MPSRNRGRPKSTLRDLSRTPLTSEERSAVREELQVNRSPIVTAILGAAIVEHELEIELRARFRRKDDDTWKVLTGDFGPLGTFNQKIIAAYGFGILNDTMKDGLDTVRSIRNAFAHSKRLFDFDHELVANELKRVKLPEGKRSKLYKELNRVRLLVGGAHASYLALCRLLAFLLVDRKDKRETKASQARRARRREETAAALDWIPITDEASLLQRHAGYRNVDPSLLGAGTVEPISPHPETTPPDKEGK